MQFIVVIITGKEKKKRGTFYFFLLVSWTPSLPSVATINDVIANLSNPMPVLFLACRDLAFGIII